MNNESFKETSRNVLLIYYTFFVLEKILIDPFRSLHANRVQVDAQVGLEEAHHQGHDGPIASVLPTSSGRPWRSAAGVPKKSAQDPGTLAKT